MTRSVLAAPIVVAALAWPSPLLAQQGAGLAGLMEVQHGRTKAITSSDPDFNSNLDRVTYIQPGETLTLADIPGPAVVNHIWLTFNDARPNWLEAGGSADPAEIVLRMYWDGAAQPAVEAPLGDFFAAGFGLRREVRSVPIQVEGGDAYNSFWQMPFATHGRITVTNESKKNVRSFYYQVDYTEVDALPADVAYFHAQYHRAFPETMGKDYLVLETEGRGQYVGTVMSVQSRSPYWFGEGDARIYIDGDTKPTIQGLGDYPDWNPRGPRDFYAPEVTVKDLYLGSYTLAAGTHTVRFELVGASPLSTGTSLGLDSVRLRERWHKKRQSLR